MRDRELEKMRDQERDREDKRREGGERVREREGGE